METYGQEWLSDNGPDTSTRLTNHDAPSVAIFDLAGCVGFVSDLLFQALNIEASIFSFAATGENMIHRTKHVEL